MSHALLHFATSHATAMTIYSSWCRLNRAISEHKQQRAYICQYTHGLEVIFIELMITHTQRCHFLTLCIGLVPDRNIFPRVVLHIHSYQNSKMQSFFFCELSLRENTSVSEEVSNANRSLCALTISSIVTASR